MHAIVHTRLKRILDTSTSETDFDSPPPKHSIRNPNPTTTKTFQSRLRINEKHELYETSSASSSSIEVDCSGRSWNCDRGRERTEEVVHRMVAHILTESSLSQNNGSSDSSEQSYMPRRWLQRNCNYSDASNESSDDNDSNEETKPTGCLENITLGQRSHHLSVSEGLQSLAWRLRKGVGTDCRRSASDSKSDVTERCPGYSIHDCKERLEYLTSKLDSWDENEDSIQFDSNVKIGRSTSDNLANCKVVLSDSRSDENALVGAFGSIMETNNSSIGDSNKYKEANSVKIEREVDQLEDENLNQQNSFCGNTEDELFNHSPLPAEQTPNVLRENETSKSSKTKAKDRLRSKSRASKSRRSKKRSSRERRFKKVVENEVLPGIRFEQVRSAIPKATLTTPVTSIRKNSILNIESESVINRKESTKPRSLMPKDLVEEAKDYEAKPKNIVYSNPNTAMQMTATNDMNSTDAATNKEAKEATETVNNAKHVFPSSSKRHHTKKPSKNNFGEQSKRRSKSSISRRTRSTSSHSSPTEKSSRKSQSMVAERKPSRKKSQTKRGVSSTSTRRTSKLKPRESQCIDLLLSDTEIQDSDLRSGTEIDAKTRAEKDTNSSPLNKANYSKHSPNDKEDTAEKPLAKIGDFFQMVFHRNESLDTERVFRKRKSFRRETETPFGQNRLAETWRRTKNAFGSIWERKLSQRHSSSGLLSFFRSLRKAKSQTKLSFTA